MSVTALQKREMEKLLEKYESRRDYAWEEKSPRRTLLAVDREHYPEYFHVSDGSFRRRFNLEMQDLENRGWVNLEWEKFQRNETLKRIILVPQGLDVLYRTVGLEPKKDHFRALAETAARGRQGAPEVLQSFYRDILEKMSLQKPLGRVFSVLACPKDWADFFKGINALCTLREEIPQRRFSVKLYGDSKRWSFMERPVLWVLKNYCLADEEGELAEREILSQWGLLDNPHPIHLAGPLEFCTPRGRVDVKTFYPDLGLSPRMVADMEVTGLQATSVVTVENLTSFYHYIDEGPMNCLIIYLGGYHNSARREILVKLRDYACKQGINLPFYHWGDMDLGGFQIWHHLCQKSGILVKPLMMDQETFMAYQGYGQSFDKVYGQKLSRLLEKGEYRIFHGLIRLMLEKGKRLEQEAVKELCGDWSL